MIGALARWGAGVEAFLLPERCPGCGAEPAPGRLLCEACWARVPRFDQAVAALLDDLEASGLIDDTLVMMLGEFGRTPKITGASPGRDHWAPCFFGLFAGAGVRGGQIIGKSDKIGAYPITPPYTPDDIGATVYHVLGIDPSVEVRDRQDRPVRLNRGEVMHSLFTGSA